MSSTYVRNCGGDDQVVTVFKNSSLFVNEKCEVISNVCTNVKPFRRASVISHEKVKL